MKFAYCKPVFYIVKKIHSITQELTTGTRTFSAKDLTNRKSWLKTQFAASLTSGSVVLICV